MRHWLLAWTIAFTVSIPLLAADPPPADLAEYRTLDKAEKTILPKDLEPGLPGHLGIGVEAADGKLKVTRIEPRSGAEAAGLQVGDVIKSVAGQAMSTAGDLKQLIQGKNAKDSVEVVVTRKDAEVKATVKLQPISSPLHAPTAGRGRPVLGLTLEVADNKGLRVESFSATSLAETAGVKAGDIITQVDGVALTSLEGLRNRLADRKVGEKVKLALLRADSVHEVAVELSPAPEPPAINQGSQQFDMATMARWDDRRPGTFRRPVYRLAVLPISFADTKLNEKIGPAAWDTALFSTDKYKEKSPTGQSVHGSLNDYYREISSGKFKVEGKVFDGITVGKKRVEYQQAQNRSTLLTEACDLLMKRDGDEALKGFDGLFFIYAGGRVQTQRGGIYWPHKSSFSHKGKRWNYFICPEGGERMGSISVVCHEFGHMLGLPDLYARPETPGSEGVGVWCTMSTGHGRDGKPLHFSAWCKEQLGWVTPTIIDPRVKQKLILGPIKGSTGECVKVLLRADGSEYLLLENRVKKGYDRDLPAEGLLIWRVVDGKLVLEESHGVAGPDGPQRFLGSVPYPSPSNRAFTPDTTPSSKPSKIGGWPVHITDIRRLEDGRITFQIGYEYL